MKLSNEARELSSRMMMKNGIRSDEVELVFRWAGEMAVKREESSISLATMADAFGRANYLDARILGVSDALKWAQDAQNLQPTVFDLACFQRIATGLMEDAIAHQEDWKDHQYTQGWREGVIGFLGNLKRGVAIGKRVA
jgi:hypothetical protein